MTFFCLITTAFLCGCFGVHARAPSWVQIVIERDRNAWGFFGGVYLLGNENEKFIEVDLARAIFVDLCEHFFNLVLGNLDAQ